MSQKSSQNPFVGLWALDPFQSKYEFGLPAQSATYQIQPERDGLTFTAKWVAADGKSYQMSFHGIADGEEYAYQNPAIADTLATTRVDAQTLDTTIKKNGQVMAHARRVLSADGQTMTITQSGMNDKGAWFDNVSVYIKQS